jgi:hypothetical protein
MKAALVGALALLCAGSANAATVTGTVNYRDTKTEACPNPATGCVPLRPIAFARIQIWNRGINPWDVWWPVGEASTDAAGHFFYSDSRGNGTFAVRVYATNFAALVQSGSSEFYAEPGFPGPNIQKSVTSANQVIDFSFDFTDPNAARFYNVAETIRRGFEHAAARRDPNGGDTLSQATLSVTSSTGNPANLSWYNPALHQVVLHVDDSFSDTRMLHEYGHWLEAQLSSFAWIPSLHDGCEARDVFGNLINSPEHAWMEGFADYFAQAVPAFLPAGTLSGVSTFGLEFPGPCTASSGDAIEDRIASTLWDLLDPANEVHDFIVGGDAALFQIFDRELDVFGVSPTIWAFRDAWKARGFDGPGLDRILAQHQILALPNQTAQFISQSVPTTMQPGETRQVSVTMRNTGVTTWTAATLHRLGSQNSQDNMRWGSNRQPLPASVSPNGQVTFTFNITAPATPGSYAFQWRMVQDGVEWFGDLSPTRLITVPSPDPPPDEDCPRFDPILRRWILCR